MPKKEEIEYYLLSQFNDILSTQFNEPENKNENINNIFHLTGFKFETDELICSMVEDGCSSITDLYKMFAHKIPYAVILLVFSPITILLNLSLIVSFIATKQVTQNTSNILIFVLSLYDLTTGAIGMPILASMLLDISAKDTCLKAQILTILSSSTQSSIILTVLLALDRYLHMNPDIRAHSSKIMKIFKKPNIYFILAAMFIITNSLSATIPFLLHDTYTVSISTSVASFYSILLLFIAFFYTRGYLRIRKFADNSPVYNESMGSTPDYVRKLYKTVLVIVSLTFIQYIPYSVVCIALAVHHSPKQLSSNPVFAYCFDFATLSLHAGFFTNCFAIIHFNTKAKSWILSKTGIQKITQQCCQN